MKATGIVRRIDDLGRVVIPKEIRRTMRIREGDPTLITLTEAEMFIMAMLEFGKRRYIRQEETVVNFEFIAVSSYLSNIFL